MINRKLLKKGFYLMMILLTTFTITSCKKEKVVEKKFPEIVSDLTSYKLEASYTTYFENGSKECNVLVYFMAPDQYRVELTGTLANEKQIMIKNNKGVFIILPSINKTFKITSDWPESTEQPYLLHSLSKDVLNNQDLMTKTENGEIILEFKTKFFNNVEPMKEKIVFDYKTKLPKDVFIYRSNDSLLNHVNIKSIEKNPKLDSNLFVVDNTITSSRLDYIDSPIKFDRSITYPTFCPVNTTLAQEIIVGDEFDKRAVMKFTGDAPFTLLEYYVKETECLKSEYFTGDIYTMAGSFALVANNTLKFYDKGIEYTLASSTLSLDDMLLIAQSLGESDIK